MSFRLPMRPVLFTALLASAALAVAWTRPQPVAAAPTSIAAADDLEAIMEGMDKNLEAVFAAIEKKDAAPALELLGKMQIACVSAKTMAPPKLRTVEEKDKAAFSAGYRKEMLQLLKTWADLEIALIDGNFDQAKKIVEAADGLKKTGHDAYKKMPRKGGPGGEEKKSSG